MLTEFYTPFPCTSNPELFFSEDPKEKAEAKAICAQCPVRKKCLTTSLVDKEEFGIWGGVGVQERNIALGKTKGRITCVSCKASKRNLSVREVEVVGQRWPTVSYASCRLCGFEWQVPKTVANELVDPEVKKAKEKALRRNLYERKKAILAAQNNNNKEKN
jgi:hypothetical protein